MTIAERLNIMTLDRGGSSSPSGLVGLALLAGFKNLQYAKKPDIINALCKYYAKPDIFKELWSKLSVGEQAMLSLQIWTKDTAEWSDYREIAEKFSMERSRQHIFISYSGGLRNYAEETSVFWLLCPGGGFVDESLLAIQNIIGTQMPFTVETYHLSKEDVTIQRESRVEDFTDLVRLCNSSRMPVTKNGLLSKSAALGFLKFSGYAEVTEAFDNTPQNVRTITELRVTLPLFVLAISSGLLIQDNGMARPGSKASSLLKLPPETLVKRLFEAYLNDKAFSEIDLITGIKAVRRGLKLYEGRKEIAKLLKLCPIGEFIDTKHFELYLRLSNKYFARRDETYVAQTQGEYFAEWDDFETPFIRIVLSAFGALGMLDLVWGKHRSDRPYDSDDASQIKAFRITKLGEFVLGLSERYTPPKQAVSKTKGGFIVQPDYSIMVADSADRLQHELFFERNLVKVSSDARMSVYQLDFSGLVHALDSGTSVAEIRDYLTRNADKPVPENVLRALDDWEKQSQRVQLRQVTILECDDPVLLEEIIRYKGMGEFVRDKINAAVTVDESATKKIKKLIEKNKRFCRDIV